jgi:hypothetical protein
MREVLTNPGQVRKNLSANSQLIAKLTEIKNNIMSCGAALPLEPPRKAGLIM